MQHTYDDAFFPNFWKTYHLFQVLQTCMQTHRSWCVRWLNTAIHTSLCMMWLRASSTSLLTFCTLSRSSRHGRSTQKCRERTI